jgi:cell division septation protein DedD
MIRAAAVALVLLMPAAAFASVQAGAQKWRAGDWSGAVAEWQEPAARGEPDALFNMGQAYRLGRGVPLNSATAIDYYRRAAEKGHVGATTNLGITLWQEGRKTEALGHLRTAADRGDLRASYVLGVATFGGDGAPRNPALGYAYVVRARDGGLALASGQAARMASRMSADDRARGDAAAAALAAGRPVAVVLAEMSGPVQTAEAETQSEGQADEDAAEGEVAQAGTPPPPRDRKARSADTAATEKAAADAGVGAKKKGQDAEQAADRQAEGWKVQLGAYANERAARTAWATLVSQSAGLLKGQKPVYAPKGGLVRLQVGPYDARGEASDLCAKLSAAGRPCFVTR